MAALALIFSMAIDLHPYPPHMILLDEVDAHLDLDNVSLL
jgi:chromosome segregation ATPase